MNRTQRIGILGGTFDPIHYGHLAIAEEVRWQLALDQVYVVPAAEQPLKQGRHSASPQQRMEMVRRACADNAALVPSEIELHREPPSYTVDTLTAFRAQLGGHTDLWFIVGGDALATLPQWHAAGTIITLARLAVVARPGTTLDLAKLEAALPGITAQLVTLDGPALDISSTALRARIAAGQPVRYQLPEPVREYIHVQGLYLHREML